MKSVLNYKKPAFWITTAAIVVCVIIAICYLTYPLREYKIRITIPAGSAGAFCYSDEEISPNGNTLTLENGDGLGDTEVVLLPVEYKEENAYEPTYMTPGMSVKMDVERGAWFKIGVNMQNSTTEDIDVYVSVNNVEVRIASVEEYNDLLETGSSGVDTFPSENPVKQIMDNSHYEREGFEEVKLTYVSIEDDDWAYYNDEPWETDTHRDALAQHALKELFNVTGFQVEECVYTTDGRSKFIFGRSAEYINKSIAFYTRDYGWTLAGENVPYMGFVNARKVHYSDVQQLISPYHDPECQGHGAIPAWFLTHSGIYGGEKLTGFDAVNLDDTVFTHINMYFDGGYYRVVTNDEIESLTEISGPYYTDDTGNISGTNNILDNRKEISFENKVQESLLNITTEFTEPVNTLSDVKMLMEKYKSTEGDLEIVNHSGRELDTGSAIDIQTEVDGKWYRVDQLYDAMWEDAAYTIPDGQTTIITTQWSYMYGELPAGSYRIVKKVMVYCAPGDYDTHYLATEFEISGNR